MIYRGNHSCQDEREQGMGKVNRKKIINIYMVHVREWKIVLAFNRTRKEGINQLQR